MDFKNSARPRSQHNPDFATGNAKPVSCHADAQQYFSLAGSRMEPVLPGEFQREHRNVILLAKALGCTRNLGRRESGQVRKPLKTEKLV